MHVLLIGAELEENLALRYLAAALEHAGHRADIVNFDGRDDVEQVLAATRLAAPELVGLSIAFQRRAHEFGELAGQLRRGGFRGHITAGGHFPTFAYRELLERYGAIDSVVRHEGERTLVELCLAVAAGGRPSELRSIRGLAFRLDDGTIEHTEPRPLEPDLDALPFPKRHGPAPVHLGIPAAFIVGSRGCYGHCTFCCIHAFVRDAGGPRYRARSVENLADELAQLRKERGARMFVFHDDDFFTRNAEHDLARVTALRDALRKRRVTDIGLVVKARPDDLDEAVFDVLEQIGLLRVYLGIEAGCTQGLRTLGRGVDLSANLRGLEFLRRRDVYTCFNMLIFDPDTTLESLRSSLGLLRAHADVPMNFCRTEIYVGTPLMTRLEREGRLVGDVFGWDYAIADPGAEQVFRIFAKVFYDRNFRCDGLMNSNLGLGYQLHLLRRFYPGTLTAELREHTTSVIVDVNLDCVERMGRIVDFVEGPHANEPQAHDDFVGALAEETTRANATLEARVAEATMRIMAAAQRSKQRPSPLWRSVAAATLALSPLACDPLTPPPPDPLPPPDPVPPPDRTQVDGGSVLVQEPPGTNRFAEPPPPRTAGTGYVVDPVPMPPDPLPEPTIDRFGPVDPPPPPTTTNKPLPPPDPPPPPTTTTRRIMPPDPLPPPTKRGPIQ